MNKDQIQQGDVLLTRVDSTTGIVTQKGGRIVLAEGEVTGHAHVIEDDEAELIRQGDRIMVRLGMATTLKHEEHKPVSVPPGIWQVGIVNEWDYFAEMARNVVD